MVLKNRIAKAAMSDSLGDGRGNPSNAQFRLYERWAEGGCALSIVGEVQGNHQYAERPGNLVLHEKSPAAAWETLARAGSGCGSRLFLQLGHAGALAYGPISSPKGPSALSVPGLTCGELTRDEIRALPGHFARTARLARRFGFGGVELHAAHGFLLGQFLSPLFNRRADDYGGSLLARARLALEVLEEVRSAVGPEFPVAIKLNSSDQLEGGLTQTEALEVVKLLDASSIDLIDISGGTYFPGAKSASDSAGSGPYFLDFARKARQVARKPLMLTGGFKSRAQAVAAIEDGYTDIVGIARGHVLDPGLARSWQGEKAQDPNFPRFSTNIEGGVTAWYTMRLTDLGEGRETPDTRSVEDALETFERRDADRTSTWNAHFTP